LISYISETYFSKKKSFDCFYFSENSKIKIATFSIKEKKFPFEKLNVDKKKVYYSPKDLRRILKEKEELKGIYDRSAKTPLFHLPFKLPLRSRVTSIYGTKRLFNKNKKSQHLGTDYRARIGQPIRSSNSGKVVLSKNLFFSGKTVIVDHGMGIFTLYGHLSKMFSKKGENIPKSGLIGAAGMTGRVTGPHLHWGVKVNGNWVDGKSLIRQSVND
jgi:murein DD-endopeptidase MepM/ murein hydrolase activator NlpD